MNAQTKKPLRLSLLAGGIAAILVSGMAIGSLVISAQGLDGAFSPDEPPEAAAAPAIAASGERTHKCPECGVIESMRIIEAADENTGVDAPGRIVAGSRNEIGGKPPRNYEITVRLRNGSRRVITDANPAKWRLGEQLTIIAGVD